MEKSSLVDADNWTFSGYKSTNLLAFISLGAAPNAVEPELLYFVTVLKDLEEEVFQLEFPKLDQAIDALNSRYHHWDFIDRSQKEDSGGCGSCEAH